MNDSLYLFILCTYQLFGRAMLDTRIFWFVLVFCVMSTTLLLKLGMHETLLQFASLYKQHNSKEADARNISRTIISLHESCHTKGENQWSGPKQNCNHNEITEYFLKQFLKLNNIFSRFNNFSNTGGSQGGFLNKNTTKIGILIPSITRKLKCQKLLQFTLFEKCLPSILNSLTGNFLYKIFIGFDASDVYFTALKTLTKSHFYIESISLVEVECQTFVAAVNTIAKKAFEEGVDYFVRINDDTVFTSSNWSTLAIEVLRNYTPPNVGVVGPSCNEGNTGILTHDMVHRSHLEIYPYYYPPVFENWWADDWITQVYQPSRVAKLQTWTVQHLLQNSRYTVDWSIADNLNKTVREGKIKLNAYGPVFKQLNISAVRSSTFFKNEI